MFTGKKINVFRRFIEDTSTGYCTEIYPVDVDIIQTHTFILSKDPKLDTLVIHLNGLKQVRHSDWDYTINNRIVSINSKWKLYIGDTYVASYYALNT